LLVVIIILGVLVAIAVPSYLGFRGKAEKAAAKANVRSAIPAAESYYNDPLVATGGNDSYTGITKLRLQGQAPGLANNILADDVGGTKYCVEDTEGGSSYYYEGGTGGTATLTAGHCPAAYTSLA
jgi:type IV pilus assembly protein PilA